MDSGISIRGAHDANDRCRQLTAQDTLAPDLMVVSAVRNPEAAWCASLR